MKLMGRLRKLEAVIDIRHMCVGCGYPHTAVSRLIVTENDDPLPSCAACGRDLDEQGRPMEVCTRIIIE